jgi:hypothetical protein
MEITVKEEEYAQYAKLGMIIRGQQFLDIGLSQRKNGYLLLMFHPLIMLVLN